MKKKFHSLGAWCDGGEHTVCKNNRDVMKVAIGCLNECVAIYLTRHKTTYKEEGSEIGATGERIHTDLSEPSMFT